MCGICGQYNFEDGAPVERRDVLRMTQTLQHRGPDDEGSHFDANLGLGFRRLSIIDLEGGHQPMSDEQRLVWVILNGEIYNFRRLRSQLESSGHRFRTQSDTEVIVHGYKQWGDDVLNRLNGMFGLAIWDVARRRLMLARDRFGIKLLYYRLENGRLLFGSEMRAVQALDSQPVQIDPMAVNLFLRYRYTPSPYTLVQGIRKLAPGTKLVVEGKKAQVVRWYCKKPRRHSPAKSPQEAFEELGEIYRRSVARHLISDVPVGLLLSGGMDSALLLALMKEHGQQWPTYTIGYGSGFKDDELSDAARTADLLQQPNHPLLLDRSRFEKALPRIVSCLEEPIAASSIVPMYFVCQRARQDVKVALVGQGPDELFGGYTRHLGVRYGAFWRSLPQAVRRPAAAAVRRLPRQEALKRGVDSLGLDDRMTRYLRVFSLLPGSKVDQLFQPGLIREDPEGIAAKCWSGLEPLLEETDELGGFQFIELRSSLPDELLMYADKLSMAHGLEVRVPYLDPEIVEYVERLPAAFKVRNGRRKWLHRRICAASLPTEILRRKKRGFAVNVVDDWFRSAVGSQMDGALRDPSSLIFRFLRPGQVGKLLREHLEGRADNHKLLFSLIVFEQWLRLQPATPMNRPLRPSPDELTFR